MSRIAALDLRRKKPGEKRARKGYGYASGQTTRMTGDWLASAQNVNDLVSGSFFKTLYRIRELVRDYPHFKRAVDLKADYIVNDGIKFQAKFKDDSGKLLTKLNQKTEDEFNFWAESCDYAGRLHYYEMMRLAERQKSESGNYIMIRRLDRSARVPIKFQMIEVDQLSGSNSYALGGAQTEIVNGIEYNINSGRIINYHFLDTRLKQFSIPARNIIHGFKTVRPNQVLGISDLVSGVLIADSIRDIMNSELDRKALQAKVLAFVKTNRPARFQTDMDSNSDGNLEEEFESAMVKYLRPEEDITLSEPPSTGDITPFVKIVLEMFSAATGLPYPYVSMDYGQMSFSTARIIQNDFGYCLRPLQTETIRQFCIPTAVDFMKYGSMSGALDIPDFFTNEIRYRKGIHWDIPKMPPVDILKEFKANIEAMKAGVRTPQQVSRDMGSGDLEDVAASYKEAFEIFKDTGFGLTDFWSGVSTASQNNPQAIEEDQ